MLVKIDERLIDIFEDLISGNYADCGCSDYDLTDSFSQPELEQIRLEMLKMKIIDEDCDTDMIQDTDILLCWLSRRVIRILKKRIKK